MPCLDELIAPPGTDDFLASIYGRTFGVFSGDPQRFDKLFGWTDLNEILATQRLGESQLSLLVGEKMLHPSAYTTQEETKGIHWRRLWPQRVSTHLKAGATLRLRELDQMHRGIGELAAALERELRERVSVNAYATSGAAQRSALHYDDHDVFVLQLDGTKWWRLYGRVEPLPLPDDVNYPTPKRAEPPAEPVAELRLNRGQVLYLPRGWWHRVQATDGASLHLTVGVYRATGADLLNWLLGRLRDSDALRTDIPRYEGEQAQREYLARIRELVSAELAQPSVLARMLTDRDAGHRADLGFTLPVVAGDPGALPCGEPVRIQLLARRAVLEHDGAAVVLRAGGQTHRYAAHIAPMLQALLAGHACSVSQLADTGGASVPDGDVRTVAASLIAAGLARLVP
jgi:hypothetical protein